MNKLHFPQKLIFLLVVSGSVSISVSSCGKPKFNSTTKVESVTQKANGNAEENASSKNSDEMLEDVDGQGSGDAEAIAQDKGLAEFKAGLLEKFFGPPQTAAAKPDTKFKFSLKRYFGGVYQSGHIKLPNALLEASVANKQSCPAGYSAIRVLETNTGNSEFQSNRIESFQCWRDWGVAPKETSANGCPVGESHILFGDKQVCSNLPKRSCDNLEGTFNFLTGECQLNIKKSLFGGSFETGLNSPHGNAVIEENGKSYTEGCENPNLFSGSSKCDCPAGFDFVSTTSIIEPNGKTLANGVPGDFDRVNVCFKSNKHPLIGGTAASESAPADGCVKPKESKISLDGKMVCSTFLADFCSDLGGRFKNGSAENQRCEIPSSVFYGGMFEVGEHDRYLSGAFSSEQKAALGISSSAPHFCETKNSLTGISEKDSKSCGCPTGFTALHAIHSLEPVSATAFDKVFMCVKL